MDLKPVALSGILTDASSTLKLVTEGVRYRGSEVSIGAADLWHIGSNTKAMTAVLYARLAEKGVVSWGLTVQELFPGLMIHEGWNGMTVEQLMSHAGGLTDAGLLGARQLIKSELDERPLSEQRLALTARALAHPPKGNRAKFTYSNANYIVLGSAIEQHTSSTWEAAIQAEVFVPLGMTSAGFGSPVGMTPFGHRPSWIPWKGGIPVPPGPAADNPPFMRPAGGIHLRLEDYAKFLRLFLGGEGSFLRAETLKKLVTTADRTTYALGWIVDDLAWAGGRTLLHDGSNTLWYATALVVPGKGLASVAVANEGSKIAAHATHALARQLLEFAAE